MNIERALKVSLELAEQNVIPISLESDQHKEQQEAVDMTNAFILACRAAGIIEAYNRNGVVDKY